MRALRAYTMGLVAILSGVYMWTVGLPDNQTAYFLIPVAVGLVAIAYIVVEAEINKIDATTKKTKRDSKEPITQEEIDLVEAEAKKLAAETKKIDAQRVRDHY